MCTHHLCCDCLLVSHKLIREVRQPKMGIESYQLVSTNQISAKPISSDVVAAELVWPCKGLLLKLSLLFVAELKMNMKR